MTLNSPEEECPLCGYVPPRAKPKTWPILLFMLFLTPSLFFTLPLLFLGIIGLPDSLPSLIIGLVFAAIAGGAFWLLRGHLD